MTKSVQDRFQDLRICVLVPTYNNSKTLGAVLEGIKQYTHRIIVVNDGSTDNTQEIIGLQNIEHVVSYPQNVGKGWALRCGFKKATALGFEYVITIDSDGQHFPEDLPKYLDVLEEHKNSDSEKALLIIGKRNMEQAGIPGKSSFGNKFSNFWYWVETGIKMDDTQSGYRLYPVKELSSLHFFTKKFEFEIEVIVRAAWRGIKVASVPVKIFYEEKSKRISHFRPFQDFSRISVLNTVLVTIAVLYIKPRDFIKGLFNRESRQRIMLQLFHPDDSAVKKAISIGFGLFMGIVPIWGFQLVTAIALSIYFKMNKALVILFANISIPPMIPIILYASHETGRIWMGNKAVSISFDKMFSLDTFTNSLLQYYLGSTTLSILVGFVAMLISYVAFKIFEKRPAEAA